MAIARALITRPEVIFADEPTGALDAGTGQQVLGLLRGLVDNAGRTVVMVTHDPVAAACADRVIFLADGRVRGELHQPGDPGGRRAPDRPGDPGGSAMIALAWHTARARAASLAGSFLALALGVALLAAMALTLVATIGAPDPVTLGRAGEV